MVHGHDFVAVGPEDNLKTARAALENKSKIKVRPSGRRRARQRSCAYSIRWSG